MSIKEIAIAGFQSNVKTKLKMHKGVNVIIGQSDCGKSAILRALHWLIRNKVEDKSFRTRGMNKTDVEVTFEDGQEVSRVQDTNNAYYLVDEKNKVDMVYKAFRTDIPEDIERALNLSAINISNQFDSPFLLSDSSGDVAKTLNKIANLTDIDSSISNIRKQVLANSREIGTMEQIITDLEEQQKTFAYLPQMEKDVIEYEKLLNQNLQLDSDYLALGMLTSKVERAKYEIGEISTFLQAETSLSQALALLDEEKSIVEAIRQLTALITAIDSNNSIINDSKEFISAEKVVENALKDMGKIESIKKEIISLDFAIKKVLVTEGQIRTATKNLDSYQAEFSALMPTQCPLCGK